MLATFADAAPTLNLSLGANDQVSISSRGNAYSLTLANSQTWTGANDADVIGVGTSTLTVTPTGIAAFTSAINIYDSGSSGGDAVTFADSGSSGYANNFAITLSNSTAGLTFSGSTSFSGAAAISATSSGGIAINSGAGIITASGAVSLIATGPNTSLTDSGNVLSAAGAITLQATGAVTVGTSVVVNSGAGNLTLAADVTANGAGDDGVGTLSIDAGATVTSYNPSTSAIKLRGAAVNIDASSNPAVVGLSHLLSTTPITTYSTGPGPGDLAFDPSGNLYVITGNTVSEFATGGTTLKATLLRFVLSRSPGVRLQRQPVCSQRG